MQIYDVKVISNGFPIAVVISRYNLDITQRLLEGVLARLNELGFTDQQITIMWVPGAVEIPLTVKRLASTNHYEAIIALGAVIFGETRHFDYVCEQVSQGCQQIALTHNMPIIFGVLTTHDRIQAEERVGGKKGHVGRQSADAAYELVSVLRQVV